MSHETEEKAVYFDDSFACKKTSKSYKEAAKKTILDTCV